MSSLATSISVRPASDDAYSGGRGAWGLAIRSGRVVIGGGIIILILLLCLLTLPWSLRIYSKTNGEMARRSPRFIESPSFVDWTPNTPPAPTGWFGYDMLGRSTLARSL